MGKPRSPRQYTPTAYLIGVAIVIVGVLFTTALAAADRAAVEERFDSVAASTMLVIESELEHAVQVLTAAQSIRELKPDFSQDEFAHYVDHVRPLPGVIGWGTFEIVEGDVTLDLFHAPGRDVTWTGADLRTRRDLRGSVASADFRNRPTVTSFAPIPALAHRASFLIVPHPALAGFAFAIVDADRLASGLPIELASQVAVTVEQSTQLPPRGVPVRNLNLGFGTRLWNLQIAAVSPRLYPTPLIVPLGLLASVAFGLLGMMVTGGITQRRRLRAEVVENDRINEAREQFIASVSHEIRTPLTAVVGYAEVLMQLWDDLTDDEALDMVRNISEQSTEVSALVKDLLVGSRADISTLHLDIHTVGVVQVTERALASIPTDMRRPVEVGFDDDREWLADPGRAAQIVRNLVVNALKYGGPNIFIESRRLPGAIVLSVVDDGEGVPGSDVSRIFEPFSSVSRASQALPSVGLGLHVSSSLARAMGGSLVYRRHNGLTAFDLELPAASISHQAAARVG